MYLLLSLLFVFSPTAKHPIYISVAQVEHNADTKSIEIGIKVFADDFEKAVFHNYGKRIKVGTETKSNTEEYIKKYFSDKFSISLNSEIFKTTFVGFEFEESDESIIWCYFMADNVSSPEYLWLYNSIFTEIHPAQTNIVHFKSQHGKHTKIFRKNSTSQSLQ